MHMTLVGDGTLRKPTHRTAKQLKSLYGARGVEILPKDTPRPCFGHSRMTHDGALRFVTMVMHFRAGYRLVEKYERRRGAAYDYIVKVRPDLIYMAPFPSIAAVAARAVAHGVMTRTGRFQPVWK